MYMEMPNHCVMPEDGFRRPRAYKHDASKQSTNATTTNTDRRTVNDRGLSVSGDGNVVNGSVTATDFESIAKSFDFGSTALDTIGKSTQDVLGLAGGVVTTGLEQQKINAVGLLDGMKEVLSFARQTTDTAKAVNESARDRVSSAFEVAHEISNGQRFMVAGGLVIAGIVAIKSMQK